jgi:hypothetical protein
MSKCFKLVNLGCDNVTRTFFVCANTLTTVPGGYCGGQMTIINGAAPDPTPNGSVKSASISLVDCSLCAGCNCTNLGDEKCDCINGGCMTAATYSTPGKYANLAACLSGCAKDSTCTGECVSAEDLAALQQAAATVQPRLCGS